MLQLGRGPGLLEEPREDERIAHERSVDELHREGAVERAIADPPNLAHPARAERAEVLVPFTRLGRGVVERGRPGTALPRGPRGRGGA
ncbi:MAG: hypothetical protein ACK559_06280, partial [bacterium]